MDHTLIAVIEMSQSSWLVAGIVPGVERQPLKKLKPNEQDLLVLLERWRGEAERAQCANELFDIAVRVVLDRPQLEAISIVRGRYLERQAA